MDVKRYCRYTSKMCEFATEFGYCKITACVKGKIMDDVKIKVIDSDKLVNAINEGSYDVNLSAVMALGAVMLDTKKQEICEYCHEDSDGYVTPIEKNNHAWLIRRGKTMKLRIGFKGEYRECDILFCPMCGRKLQWM